jgi:hypothetical protein
MKLPRPDESEPSYPKIISEEPKIWFKQDDSFE